MRRATKTIPWARLKKRTMLQVLLLVLLGLITLVATLQTKTAQKFMGRARFVPADIKVDTKAVIGAMPRPWRNLAQGGEAFDWQLTPIKNQVGALNPEYIRLDHIYDFYDIVSGSPGNLKFNFDKLDAVLDQIEAIGAKPFISLSYLPPVLANGDIVGEPINYSDWTLTVQKTIEHISGTRGTPDVYYEVWNEPDLFGGWKYYGKKNYLYLYKAASIGADRARVRQSFKFGGPANTAPYKNWFDALATYAYKNNLRFDFFSWHRYSTDVNQYITDMYNVQEWLSQYPMYESTLELLVTEWGHDSENHSGYDTNYGAAHTVAGAINMVGIVQRAFVFEIQDGKDPQGREFWGRWGLITAPESELRAKPRYWALKMLDSLPDQRVQLTGKGSNVKALAARSLNGDIQLVMTNYDPSGKSGENVPVTFENIRSGNYSINLHYLSGRDQTQKVTTSSATLRTIVPMQASDVVKLVLSKD